jgi:hypothetical protein
MPQSRQSWPAASGRYLPDAEGPGFVSLNRGYEEANLSLVGQLQSTSIRIDLHLAAIHFVSQLIPCRWAAFKSPLARVRLDASRAQDELEGEIRCGVDGKLSRI